MRDIHKDTSDRKNISFKWEFIMVLRIPQQISASSRALTCHLCCFACRILEEQLQLIYKGILKFLEFYS